jgi:hypothetical protein
MKRKYFWVIPLMCVAVYAAMFYAARAMHGQKRGQPPAQTSPVKP